MQMGSHVGWKMHTLHMRKGDPFGLAQLTKRVISQTYRVNNGTNN